MSHGSSIPTQILIRSRRFVVLSRHTGLWGGGLERFDARNVQQLRVSPQFVRYRVRRRHHLFEFERNAARRDDRNPDGLCDLHAGRRAGTLTMGRIIMAHAFCGRGLTASPLVVLLMSCALAPALAYGATSITFGKLAGYTVAMLPSLPAEATQITPRKLA